MKSSWGRGIGFQFIIAGKSCAKGIRWSIKVLNLFFRDFLHPFPSLIQCLPRSTLTFNRPTERPGKFRTLFQSMNLGVEYLLPFNQPRKSFNSSSWSTKNYVHLRLTFIFSFPRHHQREDLLAAKLFRRAQNTHLCCCCCNYWIFI